MRSIEWAKMEKRFDVDGGVSGGPALALATTCLQPFVKAGLACIRLGLECRNTAQCMHCSCHDSFSASVRLLPPVQSLSSCVCPHVPIGITSRVGTSKCGASELLCAAQAVLSASGLLCMLTFHLTVCTSSACICSPHYAHGICHVSV